MTSCTIRGCVLALLLAAFTACSREAPQEASVGVVASAQQEALGGGTVPLPIKEGSDPAELAWNGTYAELLAMDAWAACSLTQQLGTSPDVFRQGELFFSLLAARHGEAVGSDFNLCGGIDATDLSPYPLEAIFQEWIADRKKPECNIHPITRQPHGVAFDYTPSDDPTYLLPSASDLDLSGSQKEAARTEAQGQVQYAFLNLCIAKRMQDHLQSVEVTLASRDVLLEIARIVRERSLSAVFQMSLIAKAFGIPASDSVASIDNPHKIVPVLLAWRNWLADNDEEKLAEIGRDFGLAISTFIDASLDHTQLLLRTAEANKNAGIYRPVTGFDLAQRRILAGPRVFASVEGFGPFGETLPSSVAADMSAPEIGVLLGLARAADALKIHAVSSSIDLPENAQALLDAAEVYVRQQDCDAQSDMSPTCAEIPDGTAVDDYVTAQRFNIRLTHARDLVRALTEEIFGQPTDPEFEPTSDNWNYGLQGPLRVPTDLTRKLSGNHLYTGDFSATTPGGELKIDADFALTPGAKGFQDQTWAYLPPRVMRQQVHPMEQGLAFRSAWILRVDALGDSTGASAGSVLQLERPVGSVPVMAAAREALLTLDSSAAPMFDAARTSLAVLDQVIGNDSILIRRKTAVENASADPDEDGGGANHDDDDDCNPLWSYDTDGDPLTAGMTEPATCERLAATFDDENAEYEVDIVKAEVDSTPTQVRRRTMIATGSSCASPCSISELSSATDASVTTFTPAFSGVTHRIFRSSVSVPPEQTVNLALTADGDSAQTAFQGTLDASAYCDRATGETIPNTWRNEQFFIIPPPPVLAIGYTFVNSGPSVNTNLGRVVGLGGDFGTNLDRTWLVKSSDWSKPRYDALGLRLDFMPMGDAAIYGGTEGEEAYKYFLQRAKEAADDATVALQGAVDTLTAETEDRLRLTNEEVKGKELATLEMKALCGDQGPCSVPHATTGTPSPGCKTFAPGVMNYCLLMKQGLDSVIGKQAHLAAAVAAQIQSGTTDPDFSRFRGGELELLFVNQWNAWQEFELAIRVALSTGEAASEQVAAAQAHLASAQADWNLVNSEVDLAFRELIALNDETEAQRDLYTAQAADYEIQLDAALANQKTWCTSPNAFVAQQNSRAPTVSYSREDVALGATSATVCNGSGQCVPIAGCNSEMCPGWEFNPNAFQAAIDRCKQAQLDYEHKRKSVEGPKTEANPFGNAVTVVGLADALRQMADALQEKINLHDLKYEAIDKRLPAATARREEAEALVAAAQAETSTQVFNGLLSVQASWGKLLETMAAIGRAEHQAKLRVARVDLEQELATQEIQARFGLSRRFRSFDLWRARALSENARRLAVTARRAIEGRFVVEMSEMTSPEPFVEAPSIWADEIYDSDLKPPASVGRTVSPDAQGNAIYLNKLVDYVNNLELFVNGYALQRPRASVRQDTEVVQLPGPAAEKSVLALDGSLYSEVDPESVGWSFFCDASDAWVRHPNAAEFDVASFDLSTACFGAPPSRARLVFWLDPWGRVNRHIASEPFSERHNARWKALAINLVGSGIRDCSAAPDPQACYAEPFIRYDLRHIGPAWVTNHEEDWRALALPTAIIEGGKALAAEEWVDPVANSFNTPEVANVSRQELAGRPLGGTYELTLNVTPDVRVERIQRIQVLAESEYWVRQQAGDQAEVGEQVASCGNGALEEGEICEYSLSPDGGVGTGPDGGTFALCPTIAEDCDDGVVCSEDRLVGSSVLCTAECENTPITACMNGDECCPVGCSFETDKDCDIDTCGAGYFECTGDDGNESGGCESLSSAEHCTACDTPCNDSFTQVATASCSTGSCQIGCEVGYEDCDDEYTNGCEVNVFDVNNCGGCASAEENDVCTGLPNAATTSCPMGVCQITTCSGGYSNCNSQVPDGCEFNGASCWTPSNFAWTDYNFTNAPTTTLNCGTTTVNTTDPDGAGSQVVTFTNWCGTAPPAVVKTQSGSTDAVVILLKGLTVSSGAMLRLIGNRPIILAVNGNTTVAGTIDADSDATNAGAGANYSCGSSVGTNGTGNASTGGGGGGGGAFGTAGGSGGDGNGNNNNGVGGATRGNATLIPLVGGCKAGNGGGTSGGDGVGGDGGGAVQISSAGTLTVQSTGIVRANGEVGTLGTSTEGGGGGGGSGGAVLLEALTLSVDMSATITANGGNGGNGRGGTSGANGSTSSGSAGSTAADHPFNGGGGGGGGFGRVRQNDL